jgi:hypothetical protein
MPTRLSSNRLGHAETSSAKATRPERASLVEGLYRKIKDSAEKKAAKKEKAKLEIKILQLEKLQQLLALEIAESTAAESLEYIRELSPESEDTELVPEPEDTELEAAELKATEDISNLFKKLRGPNKIRIETFNKAMDAMSVAAIKKIEEETKSKLAQIDEEDLMREVPAAEPTAEPTKHAYLISHTEALKSLMSQRKSSRPGEDNRIVIQRLEERAAKLHDFCQISEQQEGLFIPDKSDVLTDLLNAITRKKRWFSTEKNSTGLGLPKAYSKTLIEKVILPNLLSASTNETKAEKIIATDKYIDYLQRKLRLNTITTILESLKPQPKLSWIKRVWPQVRKFFQKLFHWSPRKNRAMKTSRTIPISPPEATTTTIPPTTTGRLVAALEKTPRVSTQSFKFKPQDTSKSTSEQAEIEKYIKHIERVSQYTKDLSLAEIISINPNQAYGRRIADVLSCREDLKFEDVKGLNEDQIYGLKEAGLTLDQVKDERYGRHTAEVLRYTKTPGFKDFTFDEVIGINTDQAYGMLRSALTPEQVKRKNYGRHTAEVLRHRINLDFEDVINLSEKQIYGLQKLPEDRLTLDQVKHEKYGQHIADVLSCRKDLKFKDVIDLNGDQIYGLKEAGLTLEQVKDESYNFKIADVLSCRKDLDFKDVIDLNGDQIYGLKEAGLTLKQVKDKRYSRNTAELITNKQLRFRKAIHLDDAQTSAILRHCIAYKQVRRKSQKKIQRMIDKKSPPLVAARAC